MPGKDKITDRLEAAFRRIEQEKMQDVPILNHTLSVEAVDFQLWDDCWTGVLITPWFMSLMQLPSVVEDWSWQWPGQTIGRHLPGGKFEFMSGFEEETGPYLSCSLFSPMHEFTDHRTAAATAHAIMTHVMNPQEKKSPRKSLSRRQFLRGDR